MVIPNPIKLATKIIHGISICLLILLDLEDATRNAEFQDHAIWNHKGRGRISKYTEVQVQLIIFKVCGDYVESPSKHAIKNRRT